MHPAVARSAAPLASSPAGTREAAPVAIAAVAAAVASVTARHARCTQLPAPAAEKRPACPSSRAKIVLSIARIAISHVATATRVPADRAGKPCARLLSIPTAHLRLHSNSLIAKCSSQASSPRPAAAAITRALKSAVNVKKRPAAASSAAHASPIEQAADARKQVKKRVPEMHQVHAFLNLLLSACLARRRPAFLL